MGFQFFEASLVLGRYSCVGVKLGIAFSLVKQSANEVAYGLAMGGVGKWNLIGETFSS